MEIGSGSNIIYQQLHCLVPFLFCLSFVDQLFQSDGTMVVFVMGLFWMDISWLVPIIYFLEIRTSQSCHIYKCVTTFTIPDYYMVSTCTMCDSGIKCRLFCGTNYHSLVQVGEEVGSWFVLLLYIKSQNLLPLLIIS